MESKVYFVQKDESGTALIGHPLWFVVDQSGKARFPLGFDTKKAAREAIREVGLVEGSR